MLEDDTLVDKAGSPRRRVSFGKGILECFMFQDVIDDTTGGR